MLRKHRLGVTCKRVSVEVYFYARIALHSLPILATVVLQFETLTRYRKDTSSKPSVCLGRGTILVHDDVCPHRVATGGMAIAEAPLGIGLCGEAMDRG